MTAKIKTQNCAIRRWNSIGMKAIFLLMGFAWAGMVQAAGMETFDDFPASSSYGSGSFTGQDGSTWTYEEAKGDLDLTGPAATLNKAKVAYIQSGSIPGGVGTLQVNYRKESSPAPNCRVYVNGALVGSITGGDGSIQTWTSSVVNVAGDVVLLFSNKAQKGRITLDDIFWTGYSMDPTAPIFDAIDSQNAAVGVAMSFTVSATGYPTPKLGLGDTTALSGYEFTPETGVLAYTPPEKDLGEQIFVFTAENSEGGVKQEVLVKVDKKPEPSPPVFDELGEQSAAVGAAMSFTVSATGYPTPKLALGDTTASSGYEFTPETGVLAYTPPEEDLGEQIFVFTAENSEGGVKQKVVVRVKKWAFVELYDLEQTYDGGPKKVAVKTDPAGLKVVVTYDGSEKPPVDADRYDVVATVVDPKYAGWARDTLAVAQAKAVVALGDLEQVYDGTPRSVMVKTDPEGLKVKVTYEGGTTASIGASSEGSEKPPIASGTYKVVATVVDENYFGSATGKLVVSKAAATVLLGDLAQTYDGSPMSVTATTVPAGLAVGVTYDGSATPPSEAGSYAVVGTVNDANYAGTASDTLEIAKASQTIDFPVIGEQVITNVVILLASASSGLDVSFSVVSGPAVLSGSELTFTDTGTVSVAASQAGDGNWNPALDVEQTFLVKGDGIALEFSSETVTVREGGEGRVFVRLNHAPESTLVASVSRFAGDAGLTVQSGAELSFTPANWGAWKVITLTAAEDENDVDETATFQISGAGLTAGFVEATAMDDDIGENLALVSSGVAITGTRSHLMSRAIDGEHTNRSNYAFSFWTGTTKGTLTMDLQVVTMVSRIRLLNWDWSCRSHAYTLESSEDGTTWSPLADTGSEGGQGWDDWEVADVPARYLRFTALSNSVNKAICISEWEVYGTRTALPQPEFSTTTVKVHEAGEGRVFVRLSKAPSATLTAQITRSAGDESLTVQSGETLTFTPANWSVWKAVTLVAGDDGNMRDETATFQISGEGLGDGFVDATTLDDDIGENLALTSSGATISGTRSYLMPLAIDGLHTNRSNYSYLFWTAPQGTLILDLQDEMTVSRVRLLNWDWSYRTHRYTIESSTDGVSWSLLADASGSDHQGWDDWDVAETSMRYLRFIGLSNSANNAICVPEWEVFGTPPLEEGLEISYPSFNVREGGEGRFFVRMTNAPAEDVVYTVSRFAGDENLAVQGDAEVTFTPVNWNVWHPVTLSAGEDENSENETATFQLSSPGAESQFVEAVALDCDIGENLALASGGATISGRRSARLRQTINGLHTDRADYAYVFWTGASPGTMILDLQDEMTVSRVRLLNWDWSFRTHCYTIESSQDGVNWSMLIDASDSDRHGWDDWIISEASIRYLRFTGVSNSLDKAICIPEWEVYGTRPAKGASASRINRSALSDAAQSVLLEGPRPISVLTSDGPEDVMGWDAVDGDPETAWIGQSVGGGYIVVEYGPTLELSAVEVDMLEGSLTDLEFLYSLDAEEWQPLPDAEDLEKAPVDLNFLWVVFPDDGSDAVPNVIEITPNP